MSFLARIHIILVLLIQDKYCIAEDKFEKCKRSNGTIVHNFLCLEQGYETESLPSIEKPLKVQSWTKIISLNEVSILTNSYTIFLWHQSSWSDSRVCLKWNHGEEKRVIKHYADFNIWVPQLDCKGVLVFQYGGEGEGSERPILKIHRNGTFMYFLSVQLKIKCDMNLENYPFDTQTCKLLCLDKRYSNKVNFMF